MIDGPNPHPEPEPQPREPNPKQDFDPYTEDIEAGEATEAAAVELAGQIHDLVAVLPELAADGQEVNINGLNISKDGDSGKESDSGIVIQPADYHGFGILIQINPADSEDVVMEDRIGYVMVDSKDESLPTVLYDIYSSRIRRRFEEDESASKTKFKKLLKDHFSERAEFPEPDELGEIPAFEQWAKEANEAAAQSEELGQITGTDRVSLATAARLIEIVADCTRRLQTLPSQ